MSPSQSHLEQQESLCLFKTSFALTLCLSFDENSLFACSFVLLFRVSRKWCNNWATASTDKVTFTWLYKWIKNKCSFSTYFVLTYSWICVGVSRQLPILSMRKLRHRESKTFAKVSLLESGRAGVWSQGLVPESMLLSSAPFLVQDHWHWEDSLKNFPFKISGWCFTWNNTYS